MRRHWRETLLLVALGLPWLCLFVLGVLWLWQERYLWIWAAAAAVLGLIAWPLSRSVRRRSDQQAKVALGELAQPSIGWNQRERDAWADVTAIADNTASFSFLDIDPLLETARQTIEAVARKFNPDVRDAWSEFSLPEALLLAERLCHSVRREALLHIPGVRSVRLSHVLWVHRQNEQYGDAARTGWHVTHTLWRLLRVVISPLQALGQEASSAFALNTGKVLAYRVRSYGTRMFVLEVGRAAIELYSGRLTLSDEEIRTAGTQDTAGAVVATDVPIRIVLMGQVSAGKSSLLNALSADAREAVGPLPTTARVSEHRIELDGQPLVILLDMPGLAGDAANSSDALEQAARADLVLWVASAIQPAREPDRQALRMLRDWANAQLARRPPPILVALTHIDQLRPASEWSPPYNLVAPTSAKAAAIRSAVEATAATFEFATSDVVPVAMPPDGTPYNIDALWTRIASEIDEAKLVQLDRLRAGHHRLSLREIARQVENAGRFLVKGAIGSPSPNTPK
jgi:uncharacterized protein